jgi:hypothetical protein
VQHVAVDRGTDIRQVGIQVFVEHVLAADPVDDAGALRRSCSPQSALRDVGIGIIEERIGQP